MKVIIKVSLLYYVFNMIGYDTFVTVMFTLLVYLIGIPYGYPMVSVRSKGVH